MIGVHNRLRGVKCEVGTCFLDAGFTEYVLVIPGDRDLSHERHNIDIVLCYRHDQQFSRDGLSGVVTAYGDEIVPTDETSKCETCGQINSSSHCLRGPA